MTTVWPSPQSNVSSSTEAAPVAEPQASKIFRIVFFSLSTLASLLGNTAMLKAVCEYPSRKPLSFHLVTNLAVAELISTLCLPFTFVHIYLDQWPFGEFACNVIEPLQVWAGIVVTSTLAAIAAYRFVFFVFQTSTRVITHRNIILFFSLLWLVTFALSIPLFVFHRIITHEGKVHCIFEIRGDDVIDHRTPNGSTYAIVRFILNFILPYLIMVVSYCAVALKLKRYINRRERTQSTQMSVLGENAEQTQREEEPKQPQDTEKERSCSKGSRAPIKELEKDLLRMIYAVIIIFAVCYLPYQLQFLFYIFQGYERYPEAAQYGRIIQQYCFILTCLPSALHPLCYGTMSKFYARSFSRLVLCRCK